jgi:His-Xaa-Ser system protein HxsD
MNYQVASNELNIFLENDIYSQEILFKCFYWYGKSYAVNISKSDDHFIVNLKPLTKEALGDTEWINLINMIKQDLIDFKLRDIVNKETQVIRELIVAKAFAYGEKDGDPDTEITDPVGFVPKFENNE